jgi:hypothetical protein
MPSIRLPPITDFEAYNKNTQAQYEALGRFIVAFELMVNEARDCALNLLDTEALAEIAFHHPALTAKPVFEIFRALVAEFMIADAPDISPQAKDAFNGVFSTIAKEYFELTNIRNVLIHGTWHIGYSTAEDPNSENFFLSKYQPTKKGLERHDVPKHAFELLALKDRCEDARNWISHLHYCVPRLDRPSEPISERFFFKDGKWQLSHGPDIAPETLPRKSE